MAPAWRPAADRDLAGIAAVAAAVHPAYSERDAVFAERLFLWPEGCRVLGDVQGYLISHPWLLGRPPALDTLIHALPARPDTYYVHDLALLPEARGQGHAAAAVRYAVSLARRLMLPTLSLVAVGGTAAFWRRFGFVPRDVETLADGLAGYGAEAAYMVLDLGAESQAAPNVVCGTTIPSMGASDSQGARRATMDESDGGMTVNERLAVHDLVGEWDTAVGARDRRRMIAVLLRAGLPREAAAATTDAALANPARYGF